MSTELAMNTYVLLGNTLHYLLNRGAAVAEERLGAGPGALSDLNHRIEPLPPTTILGGIAALTVPERDLLARSVRLCLSTLSAEATVNLLGLPQDVAHKTLAELGLDEAAASAQA
jgi:hypothetical protein